VDSQLSSSSNLSISTDLPSLLTPQEPTKQPTVVVAEDIPPVPCQLVDKIRKWEFNNLANLLEDYSSDQVSVDQHGHILAFGSDRPQHKVKIISDILTWVQAFSIFMAILVSADSTSKDEAAGLVAHTHLIIQLSKDLGRHNDSTMTMIFGNGQQQKEFGNGENSILQSTAIVLHPNRQWLSQVGYCTNRR